MSCSCCNGYTFRRSSFRKWDYFLLLALVRPFRCLDCDERTYRVIGSIPFQNWRERQDLGRYLTVAVAFARDRAMKFRNLASSPIPPTKMQDATTSAFSPDEEENVRLENSRLN